MKTTHSRFALFGLLSCLSIKAVLAADKPALRYQALANELAIAFLKSPNNQDPDLAAYLKEEQVAGGNLKSAIELAVGAGRALVADGIPVESRHFARLLADSTGTVSTASVASRSNGVGQNGGNATTGGTGGGGAESGPTAARTAWLGSRADAIKTEAGDVLKEPHWFFHSGLRVIAPYTVDGASVLHSDKNRVNGFLEFLYSDVWAWSELRRAHTNQRVLNTFGLLTEADSWKDETQWSKGQTLHGPGPNLFHVDWKAWLDRSNGFDVQSRLSFEFGSESQASANVITGSGDVSVETSLDKHLMRGWTPYSVFSLSATTSGGLVTDRTTSRAHPRALLGLTFAASFDDPLRPKAEARRALFRATFGRALIDTIGYLDRPSSTLRTVSPGVPRYVRRYTNALEAEAYFPLFKQSFLTLGARIYYPTDPTPWSVFLGLTTPLAEVVGGLFPK